LILADLSLGRAAYDNQNWGEARSRLRAADAETPLGPEDVVRLATAAQLQGQDEEAAALLQRAHNAYLKQNEVEPAVRCAVQLIMSLINRGELAKAGGWLARCRRLLDDGQRDCVELGYLMVPAALQTLRQGNVEEASEMFHQVLHIAARYADPDLSAMGRLGRGQSLIMLGDVQGGIALFDEIMVAVTSGEISPVLAGIIYCSVIDGCRAIFDLRRAREWTKALDEWCQSQPGLVEFRGACSVFRAQLKQLNGAWSEALVEADRACARLSTPRLQPAAGDAYYQLGELHRLRGDFARAEAAFRQASSAGRSPQPGMALMRLAEGDVDAAAAAIRRERDEIRQPGQACAILPAYVEIMIAGRDLEAAREGAAALEAAAKALRAPYPDAVAAYASGAVLLALGDTRLALESLRSAAGLWRELDAPYEGARTRLLIGMACRAMGDRDAAAMELDAARATFRKLGAADLTRVHELSGETSTSRGGLSSREVEVLRLLSAGKTNRAIAADLFISEKTVARHVSNIFTKLGLSTRAAATAYAYEHGLRTRTT